MDNPARLPTQTVDRFAIWKYHRYIEYIHLSWLVHTNGFAQIFSRNWLKIQTSFLMDHQFWTTKKTLRKSEGSLAFPCLLLYWNTTHIGVSPWWKPISTVIATEGFWWMRVHSLLEVHYGQNMYQVLCGDWKNNGNKYLRDKVIGSPKTIPLWWLKLAETT